MEFKTLQERNAYVVGELLAIASKVRPAMGTHYNKFLDRPDLLFPQFWVGHKAVRNHFLHDPNVSAIMEEMTACVPLFPDRLTSGNLVVMGSYHRR